MIGHISKKRFFYCAANFVTLLGAHKVRSTTTYPFNEDIELFQTTKEFWKKGILDDYSEDHFLIRALNNDTEYFRKLFLRMHIQNIDYCSFPWTFIANLNVKAKNLIDIFGAPVIEDFFQNQLAAGKRHYQENQFFEALSEFYLLSYFANYGPAKVAEAHYEPHLVNTAKNPEARFTYENNMIADIEIKTPNFPNRDLLDNIILPTYLLNDLGRNTLINFCKKNSITCKLPRVLKIKDFMNYAGEKFSEISSEEHMNLLMINWSATDLPESGLFEPTALLCNRRNGILRNKDVAISLGISEEALNKISAIFLMLGWSPV